MPPPLQLLSPLAHRTPVPVMTSRQHWPLTQATQLPLDAEELLEMDNDPDADAEETSASQDDPELPVSRGDASSPGSSDDSEPVIIRHKRRVFRGPSGSQQSDPGPTGSSESSGQAAQSSASDDDATPKKAKGKGKQVHTEATPRAVRNPRRARQGSGEPASSGRKLRSQSRSGSGTLLPKFTFRIFGIRDELVRPVRDDILCAVQNHRQVFLYILHHTNQVVRCGNVARGESNRPVQDVESHTMGWVVLHRTNPFVAYHFGGHFSCLSNYIILSLHKTYLTHIPYVPSSRPFVFVIAGATWYVGCTSPVSFRVLTSLYYILSWPRHSCHSPSQHSSFLRIITSRWKPSPSLSFRSQRSTTRFPRSFHLSPIVLQLALHTRCWSLVSHHVLLPDVRSSQQSPP